MNNNFVPLINAYHSLSITPLNLYEIGVEMIACDFAELLFKPGIEYFKKNTDIKKFFGFKCIFILDISSLDFNKKDSMTLKSPFDGSKLVIDKSIVDLVLMLNADIFIMPEEFLNQGALNKAELGQKIYTKLSSPFRISAQPIKDACMGIAYGENIININDRKYAFDFALLQANCNCSCCTQNFTRAYLHHLYAKVPLLCQRYLTQHNIANTT